MKQRTDLECHTWPIEGPDRELILENQTRSAHYIASMTPRKAGLQSQKLLQMWHLITVEMTVFLFKNFIFTYWRKTCQGWNHKRALNATVLHNSPQPEERNAVCPSGLQAPPHNSYTSWLKNLSECNCLNDLARISAGTSQYPQKRQPTQLSNSNGNAS